MSRRCLKYIKKPTVVMIKVCNNQTLTFSEHCIYLFQLFADEKYVQTTLSRCAPSLNDLTVCLAEEKSIIFEIKKCNGLLTQALLCLSSGQKARPAHARDEPAVKAEKRGLGRCIHRCLKGQKRMTFIQCKYMCH